MSVSDELEALFLRFAQSDASKLEALVDSHLVSILNAAADQIHPETNTKALELLTHINKRLKSNQSLYVPLSPLLRAIHKSTSSTFQNLSLIYIRMGLNRQTDEIYIVQVLEAVGSKHISGKVRNELFCLIMLTISKFENEEAIRKFMKCNAGLFDDSNVLTAFLNFARLVILMPNDWSHGDANSGEFDPQDHGSRLRASGMSQSDVQAVVQLQNKDLAGIKVGLLNFLANCPIHPELMTSVFVFAFADAFMRVVDTAESMWKRLYGFDAVLTTDCCKQLYQVFLGTQKVQNLTDEQKKEPGSLHQRLKLMPFLMRSEVALNLAPYNLQLIFEILFGTGSVNPKLVSLVMDFIMQMMKCSTEKWNTTFGPVLFDGVLKFINECCDADVFDRCIAKAYMALGEIGRKCPKKAIKERAIIAELLEAANSNTSPIRLDGMLDYINTIVPLLKDCADNEKQLLQSLFASHVQHGSPRCKLTALKGLECVYSYSDATFLWLVLSASIDSTEDMRRETGRMLVSIKENRQLPSFASFVLFIKTQKQDNLKLIARAVELSRVCLLQEFDKTLALTDDISHKNSPLVIQRLKCSDNGVMQTYHELVLKTFEQIDILLPLEVNLACHLPDDLWKEKLNIIKELIFRSKKVNQISAACELYCSLQSGHLVTVAEQIIAKTDLNEGVVWLYGYLVAKFKRDSRNQMDTDQSVVSQVWGKIEKNLIKLLTSTFTEHACGALALCLSCGPLLTDADIDALIETLANIVSSRKESVKQVTKEYAGQCLGLLALEQTDERVQKIRTDLENVGEGPPQMDVQFGIGVALVDTVLIQYSPSRRDCFLETIEMYIERIGEQCILDSECGERLQNHLKCIIEEKLISSNRHLRQSSIIWLFVTIELCKFHPVLRSSDNLAQLQQAFTDGLAEANEFIQDIASQGLAKVYECCDESLKKGLVANLVESLTVGRKIKAPITGDTKLFSRGALGATPTGESISTYQELCSLASHLNKPDLIYKFMQLAQHNAMWNSKKGAAFGFQTVFEQAEKELEPFLPQIIPKLFRYQYDPSMKVQLAMKSIWKTMTKSRKGVIDEFADEIFAELLVCITDTQWRVRESSCLGLSDLLSSHCNNRMLQKFDELWHIAFKVIDDIKESVRVAAQRTLGSLQKATVQHCGSGGTNAKVVLKKCLPILLETGLKNSMPEIRGISLATVISIMKESGSLLKEYVCTLVPHLLESLSELEPTALSYLATRSTGEQLESLDNARAAQARSSPSMDALMRCVRYIDGEALRNLLPVLTDLVRGSIGLGTRTGTCTFITALCSTCAKDFRANPAIAEKLVSSLYSSLSDRNATVRKQSANTIGSLAKFCSSSALNKLFQRLIAVFLDQEADVLKKQSLAYVLKAVCQQDSELIKEHTSQLVPVVFLAVNMKKENDDAGKALQETWDEIWHDLVSGTDSALNLCSAEVLQMGKELLQNSSWEMKCNGGLILKAMAESNAIYSKEVTVDVLNTLLAALKGRTYEGKEDILMALQQVFVSKNPVFKKYIGECEKTAVFEALSKECSKKKVPYRIASFECLGQFCEQFVHEQAAVYSLQELAPILSKEVELFGSDDEGEKLEQERETLDFEKAAFVVLGRTAFIKDTQHLQKVLKLCTLRLPKSYWKTQVAAINCAKNIAASLCDIDKRVIFEYLVQLQAVMEMVTNATVSRSAVACLRVFCTRATQREIQFSSGMWNNFLNSSVAKSDDHLMRLLRDLVSKN